MFVFLLLWVLLKGIIVLLNGINLLKSVPIKFPLYYGLFLFSSYVKFITCSNLLDYLLIGLKLLYCGYFMILAGLFSIP